MARYGLFLLVGVVLLAGLACDASNPVAPTEPVPPGGSGGSSGDADFIIEFEDEISEGRVPTSNEESWTIVVNVKDADGATPPDNTVVAFTASLGNFGRDSGSNNEIKEDTRNLVGGRASIDWTPGTETGEAQILAAVGNSASRRIVEVVALEVPNADFSFEVSGLIVLFTDETSGGTNYTSTWDFDDGSCPGAAECDDTEPKHEYAGSGTYAVTLTVGNRAGETNARKLVVVGQPPEPPVASFESTPGSELTVIFTDTSTGPPSSWKWDFGDGCAADGDDGGGDDGTGGDGTGDDGTGDDGTGDDGTGTCVCPECTEQNPSHTFPSKGQYLVTLEVGNQSGTNKASNFVDVGSAIPELTSDFEFEISESGLIVTFTDTSTGAPTEWAWSFGDGSCPAAPECSEQNPIHEYTSFGEYQVELTVRDAGGSQSTARKLVAAGAPPPVADFDWTPKNAVGLRILFEDLSENTPTEWKWDFNDGCCAEPPCSAAAVAVPTCDPGTLPGSCPECTDKNPVHDYRFSGDYGVKLVVSNSGGEDDTTKLVAVDSGEDFPEARFTYIKLGGLTVDFRDLSLGPPTTWNWNFGDPGSGADNTSTNPNPIHTFSEQGVFTVVLTVANGEGESTTSQTVRFDTPVADFSYRQVGTEAVFTDQSTGGAVQWEWTFADSNGATLGTDTVQNPTFDFGAAGSYQVTLKITTAAPDELTDEITKTVTID